MALFPVACEQPPSQPARRSLTLIVLGEDMDVYLAQSLARVPEFDACRYLYCGSSKRSACDLIARIGSRSTLFSSMDYAANRRRSAASLLGYAQYRQANTTEEPQ